MVMERMIGTQISHVDVLRAQGVPLVGESVGGDFGRTVRLRVCDGQIEVRTVAHGIQHL